MISKKYQIILSILFLFGILLVSIFNAVSSEAKSCSYNDKAYQGLELTQLSQELENTGLIGRIHGAASNGKLFVLSVREPNNFFNHREFSLLPSDDRTLNTLSQTNRHDLVCVQGNIIANASPQKHVLVKSMEVLESWSTGEDAPPPYERNSEIPQELINQTQSQFVGKVHAIGGEGQILVVEYKESLFPIFAQATEYTQGLYRGDIIRLNYKIQQRPQEPIHLELDLQAEKPIEVIDAIVDWHQQNKTLAGKLVKFPQSPQLKFDVYAIEVETQGIKRTFTLINFNNMNEFQRIREKLASLWDSNLETAVSGRNMQINPNLIVEASGKLNIVSTEQANPQILLDSADDIRLQSAEI